MLLTFLNNFFFIYILNEDQYHVKTFILEKQKPPDWVAFLAMSYKKDIFAVFAYDFELLHNI